MVPLFRSPKGFRVSQIHILDKSYHIIYTLKLSISCSENGWIDNQHCEAWLLKSFLPQTAVRNTSKKPILLLCDGHGSHCTGVLLMAAFRNSIFIFKLPPHCTHKLQPLNVGVLGPLQAAFTWGVDTYVGIYGHGLCKADFVKVYLDA